MSETNQVRVAFRGWATRCASIGMLPLLTGILSACVEVPDLPTIPTPGIYKLDIQQGNVITEDMLAALEPGMERRKVRFLLGTPLIIDTFDPERWDYIYSFQEGGGKREQRHLIVVFEHDRLLRLEGDVPDSALSGDVAPEVEQVVTVPDQSRGLLGGMVPFLGNKERLPLDKKPTDDDDVEGGFFDGWLSGDDEVTTINSTEDVESSATEQSKDSVEENATTAPDSNETADSIAEIAAPDSEDTAVDETIGFFDRLTEQFGLEAPPTNTPGERN